MTAPGSPSSTPASAVTGHIGAAVPYWFGSAERPLFGWLHRPTGTVRRGGVLLCKPIGYDALLTHRAYRRMAEAFAADGVMALRFNYWGTGDSAGTDDDGCDFDGWLASLEAARHELERACGGGPITMLGARMGGTLAAISAGARPVDQLILWNPVANGRSYVRELRALAALTPGAETPGAGGELEAGGFRFPAALQMAIGAVTPQSIVQAPSPRVLLLHRDDLPPPPQLGVALRGLGCGVVETAVAGYAEMMRDPHESVTPTAAIDLMRACLIEVHPQADVPPGPSVVPAEAQRMACADPTGSVALQETARYFAAAVPLFGIETRRTADDDRARTIVLLNAGALHRTGPNRLYVTLAREWAALGYRVLRIDVSGTGDSEVLPTSTIGDPYSDAHPDDVARVVALLRAETPQMHLTLAGLCSGAYLSFTAARMGVPVERILMINPLTFYWHPGDTLQNPPVAHFANVSYYRSALTSRDRWKRLLTGQSDFGSALRTVAAEVARRVGVWRDRVVPTGASRGDDLGGDLRRIAEAGVQMRFVFSEGDPGRRLLDAGAGGVLSHLMQRSSVVLSLVANADHTFSNATYRLDLRRQLLHLLTAT